MAAYDLRPMGIGDILDTTFRLYRRRFLTFLLIALVVYVPYGILMASLTPITIQQHHAVGQHRVVVQPNQPDIAPVEIHPGQIAGVSIGIFLFAIVLLPLCSAALVQNISASYLGENLSAWQSYSRAAPRLLGLLWTEILSGLIIMVGFLLLIVPGIYFSLWFLLIVPVVVLEKTSGSSALGRSRTLMRGNLSKGLVLGFAVAIIGGIINWALSLLLALVPMNPLIMQMLSIVVAAIILPIQTAPWTLLYYDLRIRKEAFDIEKLAEQMGQPKIAAT